jgi:hypothetical protein
MTQTYRIEIRDDRGQWVPAPGDATGWTLRAARAALPGLAETLTHDYPESPTTVDGLRIIRESDDQEVR